jgi:maltooligosyltrehalose trehalohydrolase
VEGAVLGAHAFALRFLRGGPADRLVLVNLGAEERLDGIAEPLMAPPDLHRWRLVWSSEDPRYGGSGTPDLGTLGTLPAETALVLAPEGAAPAELVARD